ncbi:fumarylacetoacetate hydrolase family protein [Saliphagus infecundisoli]|uniref:Fumarylacetoacetate hydrolase family protein n=1 Tax=Saliphagus infecundisoli TaxID=1849069 RepID=A0ABD5QJ84_9EURY|nr:fumarylacetoacetate hydrolase family protein [Saliphagus infecundisoli]
MTRLARTPDGRAWLGGEAGFVPLSSADSGLSRIDDAFRAAAGGTLPDPDGATADPVPADHLAFDRVLPGDGKLWGIGLNYADHASDLDEQSPDEPASFLQPATSVVGPGGPIRLPDPALADRITVEAELGVVIGRTCSDLDEGEVDDVVAGFVPLLDATAEDVLERNPRFLTRAKAFDSFLVYGPELYVPDAGEEIEDIEVRTERNGETVAAAPIADMHFPPRELVAFHSRVATLEPGDVINTGTPGAGVVSAGDSVRASVDRVGSVSADVVR